MTIKITNAMLDIFGKGYSTPAITRLRDLFALAGVTDIELHPLEIADIKQARNAAEARLREAERIAARGPWPRPDDGSAPE